MLVTPVGKKFGKYKPGDEFIFADGPARAFIRVGKLQEVTTREVVAEVSDRTGLPKRQYRRRDMRAES